MMIQDTFYWLIKISLMSDEEKQEVIRDALGSDKDREE